MIRAHHLQKTYRTPQGTPLEILSGVSLEAERGETIAITGRSGEGKTTLLHILGTLEPADSGEISIAGQIVSPSNAAALRNRHIGFIFQSFNLLEDFSALENVLMPARIARQPISPQKGLALLESVGLLPRAHFPAKILSGGERQRVAIARALCNDPDLLFADEPSGNLDRANAQIIADLLFGLAQERGKTLLIATHDATLAARCSRRLLLEGGRLQMIEHPPASS